MTWRWIIAGCLCATYGCGEQVTQLLQTHEPAEVVEVSGDVVSRVNGSAIGLDEVVRLSDVGELHPELALSRLQAERLLGQEAERRGYGTSARTRDVVRQAQVQQLLQEAVESLEVGPEAIEAEYRAQLSRFQRPEKRAATHVLARLPADADKRTLRAAQTFIAHTIEALRATDDRAEVFAAAQREQGEPFEVVLEELPSAGYEAYVPEFSQALFSLEQPGVVDEPVRTSFGIHAIVVTAITPAATVPESVAFETLRKELSAKLRKERMDTLLTELRGHARVRLAGDAKKLLASLDF